VEYGWVWVSLLALLGLDGGQSLASLDGELGSKDFSMTMIEKSLG
jgi:hypothetical protein